MAEHRVSSGICVVCGADIRSASAPAICPGYPVDPLAGIRSADSDAKPIETLAPDRRQREAQEAALELLGQYGDDFEVYGDQRYMASFKVRKLIELAYAKGQLRMIERITGER